MLSNSQIEEARSLFPHTNNGMIYFNHASTGPMSKPVIEALNEYIKLRSEEKIDDYKKLLKLTKESKILLGGLINSEPGRIAFTQNTSAGINIIAQGIHWKKGDEILLNNIEFPANVYPFLNLKDYGVNVKFIEADNGIVTADDLINAITPSTKLISVSYVQFLSGYRIELEKLGKVCREKGIILSVDAIQGIGALSIDVKKCNIDFISCGTQKWLLGLQGMGFIYVNEDLQNKMKTIPVGWLSVENAWDFTTYDFNLKKTANRFQGGTLNAAGIYALHSALGVFNRYGFNEIEETVLNNTNYFINQLSSAGFEPILKNLPEKNLAGIVSIKSEKGAHILDSLVKNNIIAAVREDVVRFSPHFYNTKQEIDKVVAELKNY